MKKVCTLIVTMSIASAAFGQDGMSSAYSFGGACASQGVWTQTALSATQNLRKVTMQLKDDPNCKALGVSVQAALQNLETTVKDASDTPQRASRLSQLPQEISALRSFLTAAPDMKQQILRTMMDRSIESATLSAQVDETQRTSSPAQMTAASVGDFGARLQRSTKTGLSLLNQVVDSVPQLDECLAGDGQQMIGGIISAAVQVASSFASSGQDTTGSQMATTVAKISALVRERKYTKVLRKLNQQEFMTSMSCLMEVTSESYCQARDGMRLFKKGMEDLKIQKSKNTELSAGNPFVGYYILNTHVPNITKWLQKIQIGVDPKLPTDALFQNKIQQEVVDFYKGAKVLQGDFSSLVATIKAQPSLEARKQGVLKLLIQTADSMTGQVNGFNRDDGKTNFFTMSVNPVRIPFDLIGMQVPDRVLGTGGVVPMSYDDWLRANIDSIPAFNDPIALADTIGQNMNAIIRSANISAIEYFNRWYIVDKAALVNESTIDINYTVQDSLKAINKYLEEEKARIAKYGGNVAIVPTIVDTQIRINTVLKAYEGIEKMGRLALVDKDGLNASEEKVRETAEAYDKFVTTVYEQFNVMLSRSGFLANRMVNFVYQDYVTLIKNKVDFTPYQQDLFVSSGMASLDKMLQMYNGNPANIQTDLNMALRVNKGNLEALDGLLKDNIIGTIADLDRVKKDEDPGFGSTYGRVLNDRTDDWVATAKDKNPTVRKILGALHKYSLGNIVGSTWYWFKHSDRYSDNSGSSSSPQSEFDDASNVQAQFCIQALAFYDQNGIRDLCQGAVLKSPLAADVKGMNVSYDQKLNAYLNDSKLTPENRKAYNHSDRICAFRDFNIRNMARFMSLNKNQN